MTDPTASGQQQVSYYYRVKLSYQGCAYKGFQIQAPGTKTIQGELNKALMEISKSNAVRTLGSGRTDAGVHALGQVVKATIPLQINPEALKKGLNALLPGDIRVLEVDASSINFHPIKDASWKEYHYYFTNVSHPGAFGQERFSNISYPLDIDLMKKACPLFIGEHDFQNFYCTGTEVSSTVRKIFECELFHETVAGSLQQFYPDFYVFRVRGSGFLKQMVRLMVGALWEIGRKKIGCDQLEGALNGPKSLKLGKVVPPQGLVLQEVYYPELGFK